MQYGYFDDARREYVITSPRTPLPWINYLGSKDFFSLISNTCGGYSFYKDARLLRLTRYRYNNVPYDSNGKYFYIKDGDTLWNPGWQPTRTELDGYECRHGLGYSRFMGKKNGVRADLLTLVPLSDPCEVSSVTLTNESDRVREISLFSYVEWCLWDANDDASNFQRNLSTGEVEVDGADLYHKTEFRERRNHYAVFSASEKPDAFETARDRFIGFYEGADRPQGIMQGRLSCSIASGWSPIAAHQFDLKLAPGESKNLIFVLAFIEVPEDEKWAQPGIINKKPAKALLSRYRSAADVDQAMEALAQSWNELLGHYRAASSDPVLDRMVNIWHQYQCMVTFNMSRSASYYESGIGRGMGFRDSCQDLLGFVHLIPDRARERILDIAATQMPDGSAFHQYQPLTKKGNADIGSGFNDDPLWLIAGTSAYIRETGDFSILDVPVPFNNDASLSQPLMVHLKRSFDFTVTHKGPHGLPLIGRADWNDCLNLNCFSDKPGESFQTTGPSEGPVAESVFIAGLFVKYGREYARLCRLTNDAAEAERAEDEVEAVYRAILKDGWDGEWFLRAYNAFSEKVGSAECEDGQIYIEPQGFCVMAGVGIKEGLAEKALASVKDKLDTRYGIMILQPAYKTYHRELGEVSSYPPGYKENGGIFCHNNPWISIAETCLGHGSRAFEVYQKTCPAYQEGISEIRCTEPYVYCQMTAGKDAPFFGQGKNSWLTGTAAWSFVNISQYILGLYPDFDGLRIDPCLPAHLDELHLTRLFRGVTYEIHVTNPEHVEKGVCSLQVEGKSLPGQLIPYDRADQGRTVHVRVRMG